jgi:hypothetical protein
MAKEINCDRRRFLGAAIVTFAAAKPVRLVLRMHNSKRPAKHSRLPQGRRRRCLSAH